MGILFPSMLNYKLNAVLIGIFFLASQSYWFARGVNLPSPPPHPCSFHSVLLSELMNLNLSTVTQIIYSFNS